MDTIPPYGLRDRSSTPRTQVRQQKHSAKLYQHLQTDKKHRPWNKSWRLFSVLDIIRGFLRASTDENNRNDWRHELGVHQHVLPRDQRRHQEHTRWSAFSQDRAVFCRILTKLKTTARRRLGSHSDNPDSRPLRPLRRAVPIFC